MIRKINRIIISRTDAIGDVILSLPIAGILRKEKPDIEIIFLGKNYTEEIIKASKFIDKFISWDKISQLSENEQVTFFKDLKADAILHVFPNRLIAKVAKQANIKYRIGTSHRVFHWLTCNKLVKLGRRKSDLHESQLNIKLLSPLGIKTNYSTREIYKFYGLSTSKPLPEKFESLLDKNKFNLILHPKSHGSAREWGINNYTSLVDLLPSKNFKIFISGTEKEKEAVGELLNHPKIVDITGRLNLEEFISFISQSDGLVAASTGPLHIASAFGKKAIGIYPPIEPMHPGRWAPIGENASYLVVDKKCDDCRKGSFCSCIQEVTPQQVYNQLIKNEY